MAFNMSSTIFQAISFLVRPLALTQAASMVNTIQLVLRSTLTAAALETSNQKLILTFTSASPPRAVLSACIAVGIQWTNWFEMLGNRPFNLVLDTQSLAIHYEATEVLPSSTAALWIAPRFTPAKRALLAQLSPAAPQVPISKLSQRSSSTQFRSTVPSTTRAPIQPPRLALQPRISRPRTLAQELLDSDHDDEDELFAMISTTSSAIISPTPTRERFCLAQLKPIRIPHTSFSPLSSPEPASSSSDSSRPSSRSSTFSTFSVSDDESLSSASSIASSVPPQPKIASLPRAPVARRQHSEPQVFVDNTKKNTAKYLYQGGVSSTLGGGVMLGRPAASAPGPKAPSPSAAPVPKYRAPIGGKKTSSNATTWRRTAQPSFRA
ncbi:hypothetical protein BKA70DRAFT_1408224 [Coprinopsis sp. MPI-PUGE-AT-0042]|nr:hypothetical protein BKA70DRAFT_1408224 [Coprinopsis sp. MPI-PUGE-AT-0042]